MTKLNLDKIKADHRVAREFHDRSPVSVSSPKWLRLLVRHCFTNIPALIQEIERLQHELAPLKSPDKCAERAAERIPVIGFDPDYRKNLAAMIQSEYAETHRVAREAMIKAIRRIDHHPDEHQLVEQLRTALELLK